MNWSWLGTVLWAAAAGALAAPPGAAWVAPALAGHGTEVALPSPFDVRLKDGSMAGLGRCADVVRLDATIVEESSGTNAGAKAFQSARVQCQALEAVKALRRAHRSLLPASPHALAVELQRAAPVQLYLAISEDSEREVKQAQRRGQSLKQFRPDAVFRQTATDVARIEVDDTRQDVTLLAHGDFNADGFEDWLLRIDSQVDQGSYATSGLWLVTRTQANRPWRVLRRWP